MRVLFVNLPYPARFTRRYMCTYTSATSLFPPYELMSAAGEVRSRGYEILLIDCVADGIDLQSLKEIVKEFQPDALLSLIGLDSFGEDISIVDNLKKEFPKIFQMIFGHYPTTFSKEVLENSFADMVIKGEPDVVTGDIMDCLNFNKGFENIPGIAYRDDNRLVIENPGRKRISDLNKLALPAHDLIDAKNYFEPFMPNPFGMIQTSRGCPFQCNFCVTSYGNKYTVKSPETIICELEWMIEFHSIQSFRIIDDTFTIQKKRVTDFCNLLIEKRLNLKWSCLSRVDTVTYEMLKKMKESGCTRIYFGLESGSQKVLDFYRKDFKIATAEQAINWCKKLGIETVGLFMTGLPNETEEDFLETINFVSKVPLTFAGVGELTPYPGTALFDVLKDEIDFSLFPYRLRFKDLEVSKEALRRRKIFHKTFYTKIKSLIGLSKVTLREPKSSLRVMKQLVTARRYGTTLYPYLHD